MNYLKYILFTIFLFLSGEEVFAQSKKDNVTVIFSIQDIDLDPNLDTIPIIKEKDFRIYFYNNKMYYKDRYIHIFKKTEYYMEFVFFSRNNSHYIYIYPKYKDRSGPYIWYGLGVLFEITNKEIIIKSGCDYYDLPDINRLFNHDNLKLVRRIKLDRTSLFNGIH